MNITHNKNDTDKKFTEYGKKYALRMMLVLANNYYDAAMLLQQSNQFSIKDGKVVENQPDYDTGDVEFFVKIFCLEMLMKIIVAFHTDISQHSHDYKKLFKRLPSQVKNTIIGDIRERVSKEHLYSTSVNFDEKHLNILLGKFESNFKKLRYRYEDYFYKTENEIKRHINKSDERLDSALESNSYKPIYMNQKLMVDCLYCNDELEIIISVLRGYCSNKIEPFVVS